MTTYLRACPEWPGPIQAAPAKKQLTVGAAYHHKMKLLAVRLDVPLATLADRACAVLLLAHEL